MTEVSKKEVAATREAAKPAEVMSNAFDWKKTDQVRAHHSVDKAIEIITAAPRPVGPIKPAEWKGNQDDGRFWIRASGGPPNLYYTAKVPARSDDSYPVLIGTRNGAKFLIDGAHRLVRAKMDGRPTFPAIFLTEDETRECIVAGREADVEKDFAGPFLA